MMKNKRRKSLLLRIGLHFWHFPANLLIFSARLYQSTLSLYLGGQCKFRPTCSEYFCQAVQRFGAIKGGLLGAWRILRCNPLSKGGIDEVPQKKN